MENSNWVDTTAVIDSYSTLAPEDAMWNSKWAIVSYKIDDQIYTSENYIQVPMSSGVGDVVKIKYNSDNLEKVRKRHFFVGI